MARSPMPKAKCSEEKRTDCGAQPVNCTTGPCGFVQDDDIALIWLQGQNIANGVR